MRQRIRGFWELGFFFVLSFLITLPFATLAQQAAQERETVGVPWAGEKGNRETMTDIVARQQREDLLAKGKPKEIRLKKEKEIPDRDQFPQDPNSPAVARWVPSRSIADSVQTSIAPLAPQSLGVNFTGATLADTGAFPPDSMGTVGPSQFVVFVNGRIRSFNKSTGVADGVLNASPDVFFASVLTPESPPGLNFTSDPQVRYDRLSGRWFLSIIDVPSSDSTHIGDTPNRWLLAVSDAASSNALSGGTVWTFYFIQQNTVGGGNTGEFLDYPSLGVDANALYVGGNMFVASSGAFSNCTALVIRKSSVLTGGPVVVTAFRGIVPNSSLDGPYSPRGVDNYDPSSNEGYFIGSSATTFGRLVLRRVSTPGGTPSISANILLTVSSTSIPIPVQHLGNTGGNNGRLDALDDRLFAAHIRNGRLWTAHNIAVTSAGVASTTDAQRRDAVRWYELNGIRSTDNGGTPVVVQSGTIFDGAVTLSSARQYWIPSVMVSGQGHAALGFSTAGTPFRADAATVGRLVGDTLGTVQIVTNYTASTTAYNPSSDPGGTSGRRWGDYSFTSLDPNDDMTMWTIQEFCDASNSYGVRVTKLIAPPPAIPAGTSPPSVAQDSTNVNVVVTGTPVSGSGFFDPGAGFSNRISAVVNGGGVTVNSVTYANPTNITINITVAGGAPLGARTVTVTNPDGQSVTSASGILTIAPSGPTFNLNVSKTGFGGGTITSSPAGIDCGATCSASFSSNALVQLSATADANSTFTGWSGAATGSTSPVSVTMDGDKIVTADFNQVPVITSAQLTPSPNPFADDSLTVTNTVAGDAESETISFAYQWQFSTNGASFIDQGGATSVALPPAVGNSGKLWRCRITPSDATGTGTNFFTAFIAVNNRPNMLGRHNQFYSYDSDLFLATTISGSVTGSFTRSAIINEFSQGTIGTREWVELLFLKNSDARGWKLFDSNSGTNTFSASSLWSNVPAGTLLVVYNGAAKDTVLPADDTDSSDGKLVIPHSNATYFSGNWISLGNSGDSISLSDSNSTLIDGISYGSNSSQTPQLGSVGAGTSASYTNNTEAGVDLASNWQVISASSATPVAGNGTVNSNFVASLRGGTATNLFPLLRFGASGDTVPGLSINVTNGLASGVINSPTGGFYNVVIERFAGTNLVSQQYNLLVGDSNNVYVIPPGKTWAMNANYTIPGTLIVRGLLDTVGHTLIVSNTLDVSSGTASNASGLIVYHNLIGGPLPGTSQQFNSLPLISAASISPGAPVDTDDLLASVTSASDADNDPVTFAYQWQESSDNTNFNDMAFTSSLLTNTATVPGRYYRVGITPNDGIADGAPFTTSSVQIPAPPATPDLQIISIQLSGSDILINYNATGTNTYELQAEGDLTLSNWTGIATNTAAGTGPAQFIDFDAVTLTNRFYRVRLMP